MTRWAAKRRQQQRKRTPPENTEFAPAKGGGELLWAWRPYAALAAEHFLEIAALHRWRSVCVGEGGQESGGGGMIDGGVRGRVASTGVQGVEEEGEGGCREGTDEGTEEGDMKRLVEMQVNLD